MDYRLIFCSLGLLVFSGCSTSLTSGSSTQYAIEIKHAERIPIDPETAKRSKSLHAFLVGQLAIDQEEFDFALKNLKTASELADQSTPILHAKLADLYIRSGDLVKALEQAEKALALNPADSYLLLLKAGILESLERIDEVEPIYLTLLDQKPDQFDTYVLLSNLYLKKGTPEKGRKILEKFIERFPHEQLGYYSLAQNFEFQGKTKEAVENYKKAFDLNPRSLEVVRGMLRVLLRSGKVNESKEFCRVILKEQPQSVLARRVLGQLLIGEGKYDEALEHLQLLESVEEDASDTRFKIALIQIEKENYREAIRELNLVLAQHPEHGEARYYLASVYASQGQNEEAVGELEKIESESAFYFKSRAFQAFIFRQLGDLDRSEVAIRKALEKEPKNQQALGFLIMVLRDAEKLQEAQKVLERAIKDFPDNERYLFNYGFILHDLGKKQKALEVMQKVIEINPRHSDALNFVAYNLADTNQQLEAAEGYIRTALEVRPQDGFYLDTLGWILFKLGRLEEALSTMERAIKIVGNDIVVLEHYAVVLEKMKLTEQALKVYRRLLSFSEGQELSPIEQGVIERVRKKVAELSSHNSNALKLNAAAPKAS